MKPLYLLSYRLLSEAGGIRTRDTCSSINIRKENTNLPDQYKKKQRQESTKRRALPLSYGLSTGGIRTRDPERWRL